MNHPDIRPDVREFLDRQNARPTHAGVTLDFPEIRKFSAQALALMDVPMGDLAEVRDLVVPGGEGMLAARLFDARADRGPGPVIVYIHGGGFNNLSIDTHSSLTAELARQLDLPVLSISYRLAPENPWPAAPDDVEAVVRWIAGNPPVLPSRYTGLILAGDSAGGNLAAVTATALRDRPADLPVLAQILLYPKLDWRGEYPSARAFADGYGLSASDIKLLDKHYAADPDHWRASPIVADLGGLPPTVVITAGLDPLRDEGRAYAAGCIEAGVPTFFWEAEGQVHGFATFRRIIPSAITDLQHIVAIIRTTLGPLG